MAKESQDQLARRATQERQDRQVLDNEVNAVCVRACVACVPEKHFSISVNLVNRCIFSFARSLTRSLDPFHSGCELLSLSLSLCLPPSLPVSLSLRVCVCECIHSLSLYVPVFLYYVKRSALYLWLAAHS